MCDRKLVTQIFKCVLNNNLLDRFQHEYGIADFERMYQLNHQEAAELRYMVAMGDDLGGM